MIVKQVITENFVPLPKSVTEFRLASLHNYIEDSGRVIPTELKSKLEIAGILEVCDDIHVNFRYDIKDPSRAIAINNDNNGVIIKILCRNRNIFIENKVFIEFALYSWSIKDGVKEAEIDDSGVNMIVYGRFPELPVSRGNIKAKIITVKHRGVTYISHIHFKIPTYMWEVWLKEVCK